ncbi:MAG: hypothetical protein ACRYG8_02965 [Janthinobacterium lividum]
MRLPVSTLMASLTLLAGCTSPEEQHVADQQRCGGYGFTPGSESFAHCMMDTSMQRDAEAAANHRAHDSNEALKAQQKSVVEAQAQRKDLPPCHLSDAGVTQTLNGWAGPGCAGMSH